MSTRNYGIPTVDPDATLAFVDAVNGVATATDAVLHGVAGSFPTDPYELPTATTETLGGVRIGDGFKVYSDGLLTTAADKFVLKPATSTKLGGVAIGNNVTATNSGVIGIGEYAFGDMEANEKTLALGGVTTPKIQDNAVTLDQTAAALLNTLRGPGALWTNAQKTEVEVADSVNTWQSFKFAVYMLSEKVKIVIIDPTSGSRTNTFLDGWTIGAAASLPTAQGKFGAGSAIVTVASLNNDTSQTFTINDGTAFKIDFDANTITAVQAAKAFNYYAEKLTTPGIIISE